MLAGSTPFNYRAIEYKHENGVISQVKIEMADMGTRRVTLANLPPEIPDEAVCFAFSNYDEIDSREETVQGTPLFGRKRHQDCTNSFNKAYSVPHDDSGK